MTDPSSAVEVHLAAIEDINTGILRLRPSRRLSAREVANGVARLMRLRRDHTLAADRLRRVRPGQQEPEAPPGFEIEEDPRAAVNDRVEALKAKNPNSDTNTIDVTDLIRDLATRQGRHPDAAVQEALDKLAAIREREQAAQEPEQQPERHGRSEGEGHLVTYYKFAADDPDDGIVSLPTLLFSPEDTERPTHEGPMVKGPTVEQRRAQIEQRRSGRAEAAAASDRGPGLSRPAAPRSMGRAPDGWGRRRAS